jgi:hypothetical protein
MLGAESEEAALAYLRGLLDEDGVSYCVQGADGGSLAGLSREEALAKTREARFLLNVMGFVRDPELLAARAGASSSTSTPALGRSGASSGLQTCSKGATTSSRSGGTSAGRAARCQPVVSGG